MTWRALSTRPWTEVTHGSWVYTLAMDRGGFSANAAAYLTSALWTAFTATRFALSVVGAKPLTAGAATRPPLDPIYALIVDSLV